MIRKIILDGEAADIIYSPKLQDLHLPSPEKKEQQKETRRLMDTATSHYNRGWYRKAKEVLLEIDDQTVYSQLYQDHLLRTYRKLSTLYMEKEQYKDALVEMQEMFETCSNTTGADDRKYNNLLEIIKSSGSLLELPRREPGAVPSEFTGRTGRLSCIFQVKHPPDFKLSGGHAIDALKLFSLSHLLPSFLPYLDLEDHPEDGIRCRFFPPPGDRVDHDLVRFKAASGGFIAVPDQPLVLVYDWYLQERYRLDVTSFVRDSTRIKCVDVAPDLSSCLFSLNHRLFLVDAPGNSPALLFSWNLAKDIDHSVSTMFGGQLKSSAMRVTGTGFSLDGLRFYAGCSNGSVYRMDKKGYIDSIYILPANLRYVHGSRLTVKHIVEFPAYIHIYAENEILVIQRGGPDKLIRVIKVNDGEIKWYYSGFIHLVYHDVYVYSVSGQLLDVLEFRQKPRHICVISGENSGGTLIVDCDEKLYAFRLPGSNERESRKSLMVDLDAAEFSPVLASGFQPPDADKLQTRPQDETTTLSREDYTRMFSGLNARAPLWQYFTLARSAALNVDDNVFKREFVQQVLTAAQGVMPASVFNYVKLAEQIADLLGDSGWVETLHREALAVLRNRAEFRALASSIMRYGPGKEEALAFLSGVMDNSPSASVYLRRAYIIAETLDRPELAAEAQQIAKKRYMPLRRLEELFAVCLMELEELSDARKIPHVEAFIQKHRQSLNIREILYRVVSLFQPLDSVHALLAYVRYYLMAMDEPRSIKPLPLKVKNRVFQDDQQAGRFQAILRSLKKDQDLKRLETRIRRLFIPRHKPVELDSGRIEAITRQHAGTVQQLGQVLSSGEADPAPATIEAEPVETGLDAVFASSAPPSGGASIEVASFGPVQREFLKLLATHGGTLSESAVIEFTRPRKLFKNQLIDGINQLFYDSHQDLLLEDTPQGLTLNPDFIDLLRTL